VNPSTPYKMKAGTQIGHRLLKPMDKLSTLDYIMRSAN
jgi:hypothetical protein